MIKDCKGYIHDRQRPELEIVDFHRGMSTQTKYIGKRSNISLHSEKFEHSSLYVDNDRYALVEVKKRGAEGS